MSLRYAVQDLVVIGEDESFVVFANDRAFLFEGKFIPYYPLPGVWGNVHGDPMEYIRDQYELVIWNPKGRRARGVGTAMMLCRKTARPLFRTWAATKLNELEPQQAMRLAVQHKLNS